MSYQSFDPFNFEIPEKKTNSIWRKVIVILLSGIFITTSLAKIDSSSFNYNTVNIIKDCTGIKCVLTSCQ